MKPIAHRKGQVALEYLTTYGFALLAMLITIGVINYLGFFNPSTLRANECSFPTGFACKDYVLHTVGTPRLEMVLTNTYPVNLTVVEANLTLDPSSIDVPLACDPPFPAGPWAVGTNKTFTCQIAPASDYVKDQRYDGVISISFVQQGGTYVHGVRGTISTVAQ